MSDGSVRRLLLVDDSPDVLKSLTLGLQRRSFQADGFTDPFEALANFQAEKYDLALLDVNMPQMDGFQLCRELLKLDPKLKVCFFSAFENYKDRLYHEFPEIKSDCFLSKPMTITQLAIQINKFLDSNPKQEDPCEPKANPPVCEQLDHRKGNLDRNGSPSV